MIRKSANRLYKESGANMPFKEWLRQQQSVGNLEEHEGYSHAYGDDSSKKEKAPEVKKEERKIFGLSPMTLTIGVGVLIVGYWYFNKSNNN